jgi:hypothetical protein
MAVANFFSKSAAAAADVLNGFDHGQYLQRLEKTSVGLCLGESAATSAEGAVCAELAVNLLSRMFPRLAICSTGPTSHALAEKLSGLARDINPDIELLTSPPEDVALVLGADAGATSPHRLFLGSSGWVAHFSPDRPQAFGDSGIPFGAAAAACLGGANIFRILFRDQLVNKDVQPELSLSLLDYSQSGPFKSLPGNADLGEIHFAGLGAVGNAAIWVLARTNGLRGKLVGVDQELVELSNLQRYVLTTQASVNQPKTALAGATLQGTGITFQPAGKRWGEYLRERGDTQVELVAVGVDSAADRVAIQASLPKYILNAWTQTENVGVSRHAFGETACLACLYLPTGTQRHKSEVVAEQLGVPEDAKGISHLLYFNLPIPRELLQKIASRKNLPVEKLLQFEDKPISVFYSKAVCGGMLLEIGASNPAKSEVPLPFQSAMAGIMLAAECVLHKAGIKPGLSVTAIDLLRPIGSMLSQPYARRYNCFCADNTYIQRHAQKWSSPALNADTTAQKLQKIA